MIESMRDVAFLVGAVFFLAAVLIFLTYKRVL